MDISIFTDKNIEPTENDLREALSDTYDLWKAIWKYVYQKYPKAVDEWKYPGIKYGWSFRVKDKKRVIVYLLPRDKYFMIAMGFGQKATDRIMNEDISTEIKDLLMATVVYVEGRFIRFDVKDNSAINDIRKLIDIKLS